MRSYIKFLIITLTVMGCMLHTSLHAQVETIRWYTIEQAEALSKKEKRKILIDIYTNWCNNCKAMDKNTFTQQQIIKYINENFYPVKLDAEDKNNLSFRSKTYHHVNLGNVSYNELATYFVNGQMSFPTIVLLDENLNIIQALQGFKTPEQFEKILAYFGNEFHKRMPWTKFERSYPNVRN